MGIEHIKPIVLISIAIINGIFLLLVAAFQWWLNSRKRSRKYDDELNANIWNQATELEGNVILLVRELLEKLDADRICIYQLHNGEKFIHSAIHFKKITMNIEEVSDGIGKDIMNQQNMPISIFYDILKKISLSSESDEFICEDIYTSSYGNNCGNNLKEFYAGKGVKSFYAFAIRDLRERVIGLLKISFIKKSVKLSDNQLNLCRNASTKLSGYLVE